MASRYARRNEKRNRWRTHSIFRSRLHAATPRRKRKPSKKTDLPGLIEGRAICNRCKDGTSALIDSQSRVAFAKLFMQISNLSPSWPRTCDRSSVIKSANDYSIHSDSLDGDEFCIADEGPATKLQSHVSHLCRMSRRYPCTEIVVLISSSLIPKLYVLRRRGSAADTPVSQPSNSIGDKGVVSTSLGSSNGFDL